MVSPSKFLYPPENTLNSCSTPTIPLSPAGWSLSPIATVLHKVVFSCLTFSSAVLSLTPPFSLPGSSYIYESLIFFNKDKYDSWLTLSSPWEAEEDELGTCLKRACLKQVVICKTSFFYFQKASNWENSVRFHSLLSLFSLFFLSRHTIPPTHTSFYLIWKKYLPFSLI